MLPGLQSLLGTLGLLLAAVGGITAAAGAPPPARNVVPSVRGFDPVTAYRRVHEAGLRVSIPSGVDVPLTGLDPPPIVATVNPGPRTHLHAGAVVTISLRRCLCPIGSPAVSSALPRYVVPRFLGRRASVAYKWVHSKALYWSASLGPLTAGDALDLYSNYRITRQEPRPGSSLTLGIGVRRGNGGSFTPTPLKIVAVQAH